MLSLFISTLEMMGLTFVIGFFVAAVIKGIAFWADSLEYHHSHTAELAQFNNCLLYTSPSPRDTR